MQRFLSLFSRNEALAEPELGQRVYAIGDIHGRSDLFEKLLRRIHDDDVDRPPADTWIVVLGDFIDRGPDSEKMISTLKWWQETSSKVVILLGNHEQALLESLDGDEGIQDLWVGFGGKETLASFGVEPRRETEDGSEFASRLLEAVSEETVEWLRSLPTSWRSGNYFFCHAGVRPGIPLDRQASTDLLWIRKSFLRSRKYHGAVVVHGHSVCGPEVHVAHNRICVDTGAYESGILSAVALEGASRWVLNTASETTETAPAVTMTP